MVLFEDCTTRFHQLEFASQYNLIPTLEQQSQIYGMCQIILLKLLGVATELELTLSKKIKFLPKLCVYGAGISIAFPHLTASFSPSLPQVVMVLCSAAMAL